MAKIYEWSYKTQSGRITADNLKEAKRQIANKFGNPIKIPKGTVLKKVGLAKNVKKVEVVDTPQVPRNVINDSIPDGTVLTGPGGKTYTVGQRGKKPFWFQEAVIKHQGIKGVSVATVKVSNDTHADSSMMYGGNELKNTLILNKQSRVSGAASIVYEVDGKRGVCFVSEDAEIILPAKTKLWKIGGEWNIQ
jgi:hypothetical protein